MKLLLITAVREFEKDVKSMLVHAGVQSFSYAPVNGYKDLSHQVVKENWFASTMQESESVLFLVFSPLDHIDHLLDKFRQFNETQDSVSRIHVSVLQPDQIL